MSEVSRFYLVALDWQTGERLFGSFILLTPYMYRASTYALTLMTFLKLYFSVWSELGLLQKWEKGKNMSASLVGHSCKSLVESALKLIRLLCIFHSLVTS